MSDCQVRDPSRSNTEVFIYLFHFCRELQMEMLISQRLLLSVQIFKIYFFLLFKSALKPRVPGGNVKQSPPISLEVFPWRIAGSGSWVTQREFRQCWGLGEELTEEIIKVASQVPNEHCWWKRPNYVKEMWRFLLSSPLIPNNKDPSPNQRREMGIFTFSGVGGYHSCRESTEQWWCGGSGMLLPLLQDLGWLDQYNVGRPCKAQQVNKKFVSVFSPACHAGK